MVEKVVKWGCGVPSDHCFSEDYHESEESAKICYNAYLEKLELIKELEKASSEIQDFVNNIIKKYNLTTKHSGMCYEEDYQDLVKIKVDKYYPEIRSDFSLRVKYKQSEE